METCLLVPLEQGEAQLVGPRVVLYHVGEPGGGVARRIGVGGVPRPGGY